ncbi:MAG: histidine phosphatase family protein [Pseudomonadota bacterium]
MLTRKPFFYLRHGQTDWNLANRAQGQTDVPLNATGKAQARDAVAGLRQCSITSIFSSPLQRALETAEVFQKALNLPLQVIDDLKESNWGDREGLPKDGWFEDWLGGAVPNGAESLESFLQRALGGLNLALSAPGPVLIVAHGGTYWAVERFAPFHRAWDLPNACPVQHIPPSKGAPEWRRNELAPPSLKQSMR